MKVVCDVRCDDPHSYLGASATAGLPTVFLKRCANALCRAALCAGGGKSHSGMVKHSMYRRKANCTNVIGWHGPRSIFYVIFR
ncbi:hypothetical protein KCP78_08635 [Salmonella enterica subsp. enterica]|nr:hypothetical protein KCP78_08635 [Salmonella enterica subsp. enterica]